MIICDHLLPDTYLDPLIVCIQKCERIAMFRLKGSSSHLGGGGVNIKTPIHIIIIDVVIH